MLSISPKYTKMKSNEKKGINWQTTANVHHRYIKMFHVLNRMVTETEAEKESYRELFFSKQKKCNIATALVLHNNVAALYSFFI